MKQKYIIAADIELLSPMHITAIEKGKYDPGTGRVHRYDAPTGVGCSLTRTLHLADKAYQNPNENATSSMVVPQVPTIPASTVAGKLRRAAAQLLFNSLTERKLTISPAAFNTLTTGMATTELNAEGATPDTIRAARNDPFLHAFGGTSFALSSSMVICEGWPLLEMTESKLMSPPIMPVSHLSNLADMTQPLAIIRKNEVAEMRSPSIEALIGVEALAEYLEKEGTSRADSKAKKASGESGTKTDLRTFNAVEAVRAGMGFALRIAVNANSPRDLGFLVLAVQHFLRNGQVGGKGARGFGLFACPAGASRLITVDPQTNRQMPSMVLFGDVTSAYAVCDDPMLELAVAGAEDYINECDPALYEAFAAVDAAAVKRIAAGQADVVPA